MILFPHRYKKIGWLIAVPSFIMGLIIIFTDYESPLLNGTMVSIFPTLSSSGYFSNVSVNFTNTIIGAAFLIGCMLVAFSKEKIEDEFIAKMRLSSLIWAVFINYILLLVGFIIVYDIAFINVMLYNMYTVLIIFIIRFHYLLFKNAHILKYAE
ncbi:hypothetical protein ACFOWM_00385 [Ferruginibacter yonginensis]|uniref:DUF998 domain-containing protein n=1 Tax=Ferruginibacter yonginensis TaxID=1310416 RepID=A0ABV8QQK2_9BACT